MLAIFGSAVANGPQELCSPCSTQAVEDNRKSGSQILDAFVKEVPNAIQMTLGNVGGMAYTHHKQALLRPRSFAAIDGIFCMFQGNLENLTALRQEYGLAKNVNEVLLIIQAYKTLRDRGPFPADKVVAALVGHFVFVLYDTSNRVVFVAQDCECKIPFYWGTAADKSLAFSDTPEVLKAGCGKSFAPFPAGCYFSSNVGLKSYEHPLQKLKPVPRVDSQGQALGAAFKVDMSHKDKDVMHRVGSEANWARTI
ncbi:hypothetical protein GOP47_0004419 [Adiantum capillus-veneris]|uniref:DUF3700 domain-containing protein n=1 Tax=Adiantum capillus-veneris TaxID=13818 RepID=A0A9D4ZPP3_ADICA|nr:hypothetical protein GOP47_0004419 [Adiantum capillus-veneris]